MPSWDDVVAIGERLPGVSAGSWWGTPGLLVGKKGFDDKEALLRGEPETYFTTPHYEGSPHVLVRLERIGDDELRELIEDAWQLTAPRRLLGEYEEGEEN